MMGNIWDLGSLTGIVGIYQNRLLKSNDGKLIYCCSGNEPRIGNLSAMGEKDT